MRGDRETFAQPCPHEAGLLLGQEGLGQETRQVQAVDRNVEIISVSVHFNIKDQVRLPTGSVSRAPLGCLEVGRGWGVRKKEETML